MSCDRDSASFELRFPPPSVRHGPLLPELPASLLERKKAHPTTRNQRQSSVPPTNEIVFVVEDVCLYANVFKSIDFSSYEWLRNEFIAEIDSCVKSCNEIVSKVLQEKEDELYNKRLKEQKAALARKVAEAKEQQERLLAQQAEQKKKLEAERQSQEIQRRLKQIEERKEREKNSSTFGKVDASQEPPELVFARSLLKYINEKARPFVDSSPGLLSTVRRVRAQCKKTVGQIVNTAASINRCVNELGTELFRVNRSPQNLAVIYDTVAKAVCAQVESEAGDVTVRACPVARFLLTLQEVLNKNNMYVDVEDNMRCCLLDFTAMRLFKRNPFLIRGFPGCIPTSSARQVLLKKYSDPNLEVALLIERKNGLVALYAAIAGLTDTKAISKINSTTVRDWIEALVKLPKLYSDAPRFAFTILDIAGSTFLLRHPQGANDSLSKMDNIFFEKCKEFLQCDVVLLQELLKAYYETGKIAPPQGFYLES